MRMQKTDISRYPQLAYYVRKNLPEVGSIKALRRAFQSIGGIDGATLKRAVKWNDGPTIKITKLVGAVGEFTPDVSSNEIRIDESIVKDFEAGRGRRVARAGNVYLVGVTLLHELIHWADDKDGIDRAGEEGAEFERLVYGAVID